MFATNPNVLGIQNAGVRCLVGSGVLIDRTCTASCQLTSGVSRFEGCLVGEIC